MEYGKNILPADAAMYTLQNADIQAGILHMSAGGYLKYEFSEADIVALSEYIRVALVSEPFTDRYKPKVRIHIHLESEEGSFYNNTLYPTEFTSGVYLQELQMKAGKYNKFTFEVFANEAISFTMWELCPEAADEDIQTIIEGVEQSLPRLLYDYNMWPLTVSQDEKTIALITCRLLDHTDLQGHFQMTYVASEACTLTLRFKDNGATELFSPLLYDLHAGRGSVGVPHAYLERLAGIHSVIVTAQVNAGTLAIDTRGILFTIDGGYLAERMLDVGVDMRDISIRQLSQDYGPDEIWIVGIEAGEAIVRKRKYDPKATIGFTPCFSVGHAIEAAIEFDGDWILRNNDSVDTLETQENPWIFWVDTEGVLHGQLGDDETTKVQLDTNVSKVYACRGFSSMYYKEQDQGLVLAYLKDGKVYYTQYVYNPTAKECRWSDIFVLDESLSNVKSVAVQRLNDYRLGFTIVLPDETRLYITDRMYVAQAVPKESINTFLADNTAWLYCPKDTDLSVNAHVSTSDDLLTITITLDRLLKVFSYDLYGLVTFDDSIPEENIKSITWQNNKNTSNIIIKLKAVPTKLLTKVYINKIQSADLQCCINAYGAIICPSIVLEVDTTVYRYFDISEQFNTNIIDDIQYYPIGKQTYHIMEEFNVAVIDDLLYTQIERKKNYFEENLACTTLDNFTYTQVGAEPI